MFLDPSFATQTPYSDSGMSSVCGIVCFGVVYLVVLDHICVSGEWVVRVVVCGT